MTAINQTTNSLLARLMGPGGPFELAVEVWGEARVPTFKRPPHTLAEVFRRCRLFGDRPYVLCDDGEVSFGEALGQAARLREHITGHGVSPGDRVGLVIESPFDWPRAFIATLSVGATAVLLDASWDDFELGAAAEVAGCDWLIFNKSRSCPPGLKAIPLPERANGGGNWAEGAFVEAKPTDEALILMTSGSTGFPKGMVFDHKAILTGLQNMMLGAAMLGSNTGRQPLSPVRPGPPTSLVTAPLSHIAGCAQILLAAMTGGRVIFRNWGPNIVHLVASEKLQSLGGLTPAMLDDLVAAFDKGVDLSSLRSLNVQGGGVAEARLAQLRKRAPHLALTFGYGLSETFGSVAVGAAGEDRYDGGMEIVPTAQVRIVNDSQEPMPPGIAGRIELRGRMLAKSYCENRSGLAPGKWFDSGDVGRLNETGRLVVLDRARDCLWSNGHPTSAGELEYAASSFPQILHAVASVDTRRSGFILKVVLHPDSQIPLNVLQASLKAACPAFTTEVEIVPASTLQRGRSGKFLRNS